MKRFLSFGALLVLAACNSPAEPDPVVEPLVVDEPQVVSLLNGTPADLDALIDGRPAILNFWAASCAFCRHELPLFEAIAQNNADIAVIGINMQEPAAVASKYWQDGGYTFATLLDPDNELRREYQVSIQPTTIFLSPEKGIVSRKDGPLSEAELNERVDELTALVQEDEVETEPESAPEERVIEPHEEAVSVQIKDHKGKTIQTSEVPPMLLGWYRDTVKHLIPLDTILSGGPPRDGIPSIDEPKFLTVNEASYLQDDDVGILVRIDGEVRFYPYRVLNWHEIVNDTVAGRQLFVTYCPLCATGVVYGRNISAGETTFGVSGMLAESNLLMYDRATDSLWNQVTGQAVVGPLTGELLEFIRSDIVMFSFVKEHYPQAQILSTDTGRNRDYSRDPYQGYEDRPDTIFPVSAEDSRLPAKELIYGIVVNGQAKAYREIDVLATNKIWDHVGDVPVLVETNAKTGQTYFRNPYTGEQFPEIPAFWFSWVAQYPETQLYTQ